MSIFDRRGCAIRFTCALAISAGTFDLHAQVDPGPRGGPPAAGGSFPGLNSSEQSFFTQALQHFKEVDSVSGTVPGEAGSGLGPTFNGNSCAMCHAQPDVGGSSPGLMSKQNPVPNPQVALAVLDGATNVVPSFITAQGPVREARFIAVLNQSSPSLDGGVHGLYTIQGRTDANGCQLAQPDFTTQVAKQNIIFRIPTPLFGLGLVENTPDSALQANLAAAQDVKNALGIAGRMNSSGNDGTVMRFGWKAQNKSLLIFAGEAYNVEQGVSNEAFPNKRSVVDGCVYNAIPDDHSNMTNPSDGTIAGTLSQMSSDLINFAGFMRLTAPPTSATSSVSEKNGQALFSSIGCAMCHSPSLTTGSSRFTGMSYVTYHPYSDFALHHVGSNLADGIYQGAAGPDEFRTAPLWGAGQRLFFLHDGRTSDLLQAIEQHASPGDNCLTSKGRSRSGQNQSCASEANVVISKFDALSAAQKQDILNFLRSL
jgi:CxxC motif-containing protein (DUF1111 family)